MAKNFTRLDHAVSSVGFFEGLGHLGTYLVPCLLGYPLLVAYLRHRRERQMRKKFNYPTRDSMKAMTVDDACAIIKYLAELEFPFMYFKALQFALFKTYGIGTTSSLLVSTKQLSSNETVGKRYADTVVLISEFVANPPTSERGIAAIARMNYLHGHYQKQGKISNDDMLYTLALFPLEPLRWIGSHEWRALNEMEVCALGTFWKSIGDAMGIDYADLPSAQTGWKDGVHWLSEVEVWADAFEKANMLPHTNNRKLADYTIKILLWNVPSSLRDVGVKAITALLGDRLRTSMLFDKPSAGYFFAVNAALMVRKLILRYLALPRPEWLPIRRVQDTPNPTTGRYNFNTWEAEPWYISKRARWSLDGLLTRLLPNGTLPGDNGDRYASEGYHIAEIGPKGMKGKGAEVMALEKEKLRAQITGGCPFAFS